MPVRTWPPAGLAHCIKWVDGMWIVAEMQPECSCHVPVAVRCMKCGQRTCVACSLTSCSCVYAGKFDPVVFSDVDSAFLQVEVPSAVLLTQTQAVVQDEQNVFVPEIDWSDSDRFALSDMSEISVESDSHESFETVLSSAPPSHDSENWFPSSDEDDVVSGSGRVLSLHKFLELGELSPRE